MCVPSYAAHRRGIVCSTCAFRQPPPPPRRLSQTLATQEVKFGGAKNWSMVNFTGLTPSAGTSCVGLTESTAEVTCGKMGPHSHICVQCGGEFVIGLSQPGAANVDYVYLQPGAWRGHQ